jgi:hypothetical protein
MQSSSLCHVGGAQTEALIAPGPAAYARETDAGQCFDPHS